MAIEFDIVPKIDYPTSGTVLSVKLKKVIIDVNWLTMKHIILKFGKFGKWRITVISGLLFLYS